ncbi:MAG TPA: MraY family glycosyltransferase [Solirubrobacteraceae bacterium]|nr:MraY family glycosyltransferase [Solirubrobacteraceae bacterium]
MRPIDAVYAFFAAGAVALLLTPVAARVARRVGAIAFPSERGLSRQPMPLLGGVAILIGFLLAATIWLPDTIHLAPPAHAKHGTHIIVHKWPLIGGAVLIAIVGVVDDIRNLRPGVKLLGQIAAAVLAVTAGGATITDLTIPFIGSLQFQDGGYPLAAIWLVVLMNVVNLSDGVDGLASGVCAIDGIAFAVIAFNLQHGTSAAGVLAAITAGASLGFLFHNFYPAKVFMGDAGALLLGYLLGLTAILGSLKTGAVVALVVPLLILAVPFLDTGFVVAKRLKYGRKPWEADANHFHHRMARIGFSQRKTIAYLYAWTLMFAGVAVALKFVPYDNGQGHYYLGWSIVMGVILLAGLAASVYLVYVLEILKFKSMRIRVRRREAPELPEEQLEEIAEHDVDTGEFEQVRQ